MTKREYYHEIFDIVNELVSECEGDEDRIQDMIHETVDGHQWIIYTHYNIEVLQHSNNHDAYFDNFGPLAADGFSDAMAKMAFAAMYQDCQEEVSDALERWREAHSEEE